jgi:dephospho-CoA kinase
MIVIGLTGGVATGKSTVAKLFKQCGAIVIDADALARECSLLWNRYSTP